MSGQEICWLLGALPAESRFEMTTALGQIDQLDLETHPGLAMASRVCSFTGRSCLTSKAQLLSQPLSL